MKSDLVGKTALVTGGAKRLGRATCLALADAGVNVVVHHRTSSAEAEQLADQLKGLGVGAWTARADLGNQNELEGLVENAIALAGRLDVLINNASIFPSSDFDSMTLDQLRDSVDINAWAPFVLGREFARRTETGHIINFVDTRINSYDWSHVAYHASKYLLALFTRMMAIRFAPGISVNAIAPGLILPPEGKDQDYLESLKDSTLLKRVGNPGEVAEAVLFLLRSDFITGQVIYVDGGRHMREANLG